MTIEEAKQIKLQDYLHSLGFSPVKQQGDNLWYKSPFRDESEASFKVNTKLNQWYGMAATSLPWHHACIPHLESPISCTGLRNRLRTFVRYLSLFVSSPFPNRAFRVWKSGRCRHRHYWIT